MNGLCLGYSPVLLRVLKPRLSGFYGTRAFTDKPDACNNCGTIPALLQCYAFVLSLYLQAFEITVPNENNVTEICVQVSG